MHNRLGNIRLRAIGLVLLLGAALSSCGLLGSGNRPAVSTVRSLTGDGFQGKKYYLGWGEVLDGSMGNETYYDVKHTHDVFTTGVGGNYIGQALTRDNSEVSGSSVESALQGFRGRITPLDMYVQYSSGHGYQGGLGIGIDYSTIVNAVLSFNARETIVFTMACHSGSIVDTFNQYRDAWANYATQGRTLFVMASSTTEQTSSTGPGTDQQQQGPSGSAGSAFGHALWKALYYADGYIDGVRDGFITLGELEIYTKALTEREGGHTPVTTGVYNPYLIMNKSPQASPSGAMPPQYIGGGDPLANGGF